MIVSVPSSTGQVTSSQLPSASPLSPSASNAVLWLETIPDTALLVVGYLSGVVAVWNADCRMRIADLSVSTTGPVLMAMRKKGSQPTGPNGPSGSGGSGGGGWTGAEVGSNLGRMLLSGSAASGGKAPKVAGSALRKDSSSASATISAAAAAPSSLPPPLQTPSSQTATAGAAGGASAASHMKMSSVQAAGRSAWTVDSDSDSDHSRASSVRSLLT